jgi:osmotically-inducible protein OsmY
VSRANLIQAVASAPKGLEIPLSDSAIRDKLLAHLKKQPWAHTDLLNVTVNYGVVHLWGITNSNTEKEAIRVAAETMPGVRSVINQLMLRPRSFYGD